MKCPKLHSRKEEAEFNPKSVRFQRSEQQHLSHFSKSRQKWAGIQQVSLLSEPLFSRLCNGDEVKHNPQQGLMEEPKDVIPMSFHCEPKHTIQMRGESITAGRRRQRGWD